MARSTTPDPDNFFMRLHVTFGPAFSDPPELTLDDFIAVMRKHGQNQTGFVGQALAEVADRLDDYKDQQPDRYDVKERPLDVYVGPCGQCYVDGMLDPDTQLICYDWPANQNCACYGCR